jgi:predicted RNA-binding Zn-ribbon protein involved in translation (DUF1610 family)
MSGPVERVEVECPSCGERYETLYRSSINRDVDPWVTGDYVREMTTGTCPRCGKTVDLGTLIVEGGAWIVG